MIIDLEQPITKLKLRKFVKEIMKGLKAPRPNGITIKFFTKF
jgi:hypothetical protein